MIFKVHKKARVPWKERVVLEDEDMYKETLQLQTFCPAKMMPKNRIYNLNKYCYGLRNQKQMVQANF